MDSKGNHPQMALIQVSEILQFTHHYVANDRRVYAEYWIVQTWLFAGETAEFPIQWGQS
jgi:hypothetical protein